MSVEEEKISLIKQENTTANDKDPNTTSPIATNVNIATNPSNSSAVVGNNVSKLNGNKRAFNVKSQAQRDHEKLNLFLTPMLDDLDKLVEENLREMDRLEEQFFSERLREKELVQISHVPAEIREGKPIEAIMKTFEQILGDVKSETQTNHFKNFLQAKIEDKQQSSLNVNEEVAPKESEIKSQSGQGDEISKDDSSFSDSASDSFESKLNPTSKIGCLAHSLTSYLITVNKKNNSEKLKSLTVKFYDAVNLWVSRLFRFQDSSILFHDQESDGLTRMCSMLFNYKYTNYKVNGYQSIQKQPTIYISAASKYSHIDYRELISIQLGLPLSSIRLVNVFKTIDENLDKIDMAAFSAQVDEDVKNGLCPLVLIANAGSYNIGQCDDIQELNNICSRYNMWLHLEGIYLSTLVLYSVPTAVQPVQSGDSITINLADWIGVPSLSYITLYKNVKNSGTYIQPFNSYIFTLQKCLPYWCVIQGLGHSGILKKIQSPNELSNLMIDVIKRHSPYLKIMNFKNPSGSETITQVTLSDLFVKALGFLTYVDLNNPIVIFKCNQEFIKERLYILMNPDYEKEKLAAEQKEKALKKNVKDDLFVKMMQDIEPIFESDIKKKKIKEELAKKNEEKASYDEYSKQVQEYTDTLTTWLCELMNSLHKKIEFELIEIENEGICIRYSPLEHSNIYGTSQGDLDNFKKSLDDVIDILDASIKCRTSFERDIKQFANLIPVNVPKWAGIGAVRFIPDYLLDKLDQISLNLETKKSNKNNENAIETIKIPDLLSQDSSISNDEKAISKVDDANERKNSNNTENIIEKENSESNEPAPDEALATTTSSDSPKPKQIDNLDKYIQEMIKINEQLLKDLQAQDGAFTLGEASDGLIAIKFGMVNETEAIFKLARQVQDVGKKVEESSRFIETMSELIRQGILKANEDLRKENEQKLVQQGLLRQIPIVSGIFNWIAPVEPVNTIGRTFNLQSGKIATTEVTYKYHMQIEETAEKKAAEAASENENNTSTTSEEAQPNGSVHSNIVEEKVKSLSDRGERKLSTNSVQSNLSNIAINGEEANK